MSGVDNMGVPDIMREELAKLVSMTRKSSEIRNDSSITSVLENIDSTLREGHDDAIPELASLLLDALSKSGLSRKIKLELSQRARTIWKGWEINIHDLEFIRKRNGDRKPPIGGGAFGRVYLGRMKLRDEDGEIIDGEYVEVAVKQFTVLRSNAEALFPQFIRESFLQKNAQHACIVQTYGGYWPSPEEIEEDDEAIEPLIVMERMTHNLRSVLDKGLLNSMDLKRRVLNDIAAGIGHLHSLGIVHRDIKPENVLMRVVDGEIIGRAKVCDFGVSRKAEITDLKTYTTHCFTKPTGSSHYMPPEAFNNTVRDCSKRARDVWSLGVLMCEVLQSGFLEELVREHPDAGRSEFSKKVSEKAQHIPCDWVLDHVALSCLLLDPALRPKIKDVRIQMANDAPVYQFPVNYIYSWEYKANEVRRYVRKRFSVDVQLDGMEIAIPVLEETIQKTGDSSAQSVLGYCYYYGIGVTKDEEKGISLFQKGCDEGDAMAVYSLSSIHWWAKRFDIATSLLARAAELGSIAALDGLGVCYLNGMGIEQDEKRGFQLLSAATEAGNEEAAPTLVDCLVQGIGTEKEEGKGVEMQRKLTASGNAAATMQLAKWYAQGILLPKDAEKAKQLAALAHKRGICYHTED